MAVVGQDKNFRHFLFSVFPDLKNIPSIREVTMRSAVDDVVTLTVQFMPEGGPGVMTKVYRLIEETAVERMATPFPNEVECATDEDLRRAQRSFLNLKTQVVRTVQVA